MAGGGYGPLPPPSTRTSSSLFVLRVCVTRCGTPTNLIKMLGRKRVCVRILCRRDSSPGE